MACWFLANLAGEDYFQVCLLWVSHSLQLVSFFFSCFCWFLDDFCWLGVSMLISLALMVFFLRTRLALFQFPKGCFIVMFCFLFIWYSFDFTHPRMSSLIDRWVHFYSHYLHSVFIFPCFGYLVMECIIAPISVHGSKELQRIYIQWWIGYMLLYESYRQESVFSERGSWGYREEITWEARQETRAGGFWERSFRRSIGDRESSEWQPRIWVEEETSRLWCEEETFS